MMAGKCDGSMSSARICTSSSALLFESLCVLYTAGIGWVRVRRGCSWFMVPDIFVGCVIYYQYDGIHCGFISVGDLWL